MRNSITEHWLTPTEGWQTLADDSRYPFADIVAVDQSGETVLVVCANGSDQMREFSYALGKLLLMMDREFSINSFGLPQPDANLVPPLIRYVLAVPAGDDWLQLLRTVPDRIRGLLHLILLRVSDGEVVKYLPGVAV